MLRCAALRWTELDEVNTAEVRLTNPYRSALIRNEDLDFEQSRKLGRLYRRSLYRRRTIIHLFHEKLIKGLMLVVPT